MKKSNKVVPEGNSYCRNWALELYHDWDNYDEVIKYIEIHYVNYAYIVHDMDIWTDDDYKTKKEYMDKNDIHVGDLKKIHTHVAVQFPNPRYRFTIAKELNIDNNFVRSSRKFKKYLRYLIHYDEIDKYHYSILDVKGTLQRKVRLYCESTEEIEVKSDEILDLIVSRSHWTLYEFGREINKRGLYSVFRSGYSYYRDVIADHNMGVC